MPTYFLLACRHKMSIMFNEICINEEMLPKYTYFKIYIYIKVSKSGDLSQG